MLILRAFAGLAFLLVLLALAIFGVAGTLDYWQGWLFLATFGTATLLVTLYLMVKDRALLERRVEAGPGAEQQGGQRLIQWIATAAFIAIFIVSPLDHRFGWTDPSASIVIIGDVLVALGLFFVFLVFRENSFTAGTIQVAEGQRVIDTGPYALVRHPMYAGAFVMLIGVPPALDSYFGLLAVVPLMRVIAWRAQEEERYLAANLEGYSAYLGKVRHRLVPGLW